VLALLFLGFLQPLTILTALPLAVGGASGKRTRPILMTSVAMLAGMPPIAMASESSFRAPSGAVVIGGLLT